MGDYLTEAEDIKTNLVLVGLLKEYEKFATLFLYSKDVRTLKNCTTTDYFRQGNC